MIKISFKSLEKAVKLDFNSLFFKVWKKRAVQKFIEELNRQQLAKSIDSKGVQLSYKTKDGVLRTGYSFFTAKASRGRKKEGDPFTLEDTGEFYKSIKALPELVGVDFFADLEKDKKFLKKRFGKNIVGLTNENIEILRKFVLPILQEEIKKELGLL